MNRAFTVKLGARARAKIGRDGLKPQDITCIPAAAGGPKGLALIPLDQWLFGEWLWLAQPTGQAARHEPTLIGASIGAWRMAAAAQSDPVAALAELSRTYIEDQVYEPGPSPAEVARLIRMLADSTFGAGEGRWVPRAQVSLRVLTARAGGALAGNASRGAFAQAALANLAGRKHLARHLRRVVFAGGPPSQIDVMLNGAAPDAAVNGFDAFGAERVALTSVNAGPSLQASGSVPLICDPVKVTDAAAAAMPAGSYWDGGLIDYHLFYPYAKLDGLVLYPHFVDAIVPGWLDKFVPWRKQGVGGRGSEWLTNVILISPGREFLATLPNGKLPDRNDFYRYGADHRRRIADWKRGVAECQRFAEQAAAWLTKPDLSIALPL